MEIGNYPEALDYDFRALKLDQELNDGKTIAAVTGNIGNVYTLTENYVLAEKYLKTALRIADSI
ncbi:tetratricopeptide repeat protein, partial [Staphylococcus aureus]|uniref:tetratricopeptide repeat protein n=1 Tax=Staphylococcus aureus TaxID=1280 RepID=UPI002264F673